MGCENSNEISNLNQTEPTNRILTVNQNNILSPKNNNKQQNKILFKRRGTKTMSLRKSIVDKNKNPNIEYPKRKKEEDKVKDIQKLKIKRKSVQTNFSKLFKNNAKAIHNLNYEVKFSSFKIQNIVDSCDVGFKISLAGIDSQNKYCSYDPEVFPGLIFKMLDPIIYHL